MPISKRRGALRHTDEGERFDDFAIRQEWWTGESLPEATVVRRELAGAPKIEVVGRSKEKVEELFWDAVTQARADSLESRGNRLLVFHAADGIKAARRLDISAAVRHCRRMDGRDLERLGHHVVSRRVALGYRSRTDLAGSLQFTVRTLADIEHGVRKASPGTYAILENKLGWAPGSIDAILAGGEPTETVPTLHRSAPPRPRDMGSGRATPTPCHSFPPTSCCWNCGGASSFPARDAATPGTTGTTASTLTATGPKRAHDDGLRTTPSGLRQHRLHQHHVVVRPQRQVVIHLFARRPRVQ